ncbi:MAG: hypothetical protein H6883_10000 [Rhodobiaceae bacterium]|nr:hypothetical protein [Rhodobiaceae bacterium]MCC0056460.1 hypothetical protein [Rhodobiaceae bacterium]
MGIAILQTLLLLLIAFLIGAAIGCVLRRIGSDVKPVGRPADSGDGAAARSETAIMTIPDPMTGMTVIEPPAPIKEEPAPARQKKTAKPAAKAASRSSAAASTRPRAPRKAPATKAAGNDDLKLISGIGKLNEDRLKKEGVTTFAQIASWTKKDVAAFDEKLNFKGRIEREDWVGQAKTLAKGGQTEFSARKGKNPRK